MFAIVYKAVCELKQDETLPRQTKRVSTTIPAPLEGSKRSREPASRRTHPESQIRSCRPPDADALEVRRTSGRREGKGGGCVYHQLSSQKRKQHKLPGTLHCFSAAHNSNSNSSSYQELFNYFFSVASTASKLDAKKKGIDG